MDDANEEKSVLDRLQELLDELIDNSVDSSGKTLEYAQRGDELLAELEIAIESVENVADFESEITRLHGRIEELENEVCDREDDICVLEQEIERLQDEDEEDGDDF